MTATISTEQALIYAMVTMSGVEGKINAVELAEIRQLVQTLPIFRDFDEHRLITVAQEAGDILQETEGLAAVLGLIKGALSPRLRETPMRWPSRSPRPISRWAARSCASWPCCAIRSNSTSW